MFNGALLRNDALPGNDALCRKSHGAALPFRIRCLPLLKASTTRQIPALNASDAWSTDNAVEVLGAQASWEKGEESKPICLVLLFSFVLFLTEELCQCGCPCCGERFFLAVLQLLLHQAGLGETGTAVGCLVLRVKIGNMT